MRLRETGLLSRRAASLALALAVAPLVHDAQAIDWPYSSPGPPLFETTSNILYYDVPTTGSPFGSDIPAPWKPEVVLSPEFRDPLPPGDVINPDGTSLGLNYRVRGKQMRGEIIECSDCMGLGTVTFTVGDGSVNAAVDELVRTLKPGVTRRAVIPSSFKLIRENQVMAGTKWPVPSFVELNLGIRTGIPTFLCSQVDGSCICEPTAAKGGTDMQPKRD